MNTQKIILIVAFLTLNEINKNFHISINCYLSVFHQYDLNLTGFKNQLGFHETITLLCVKFTFSLILYQFNLIFCWLTLKVYLF